MIYVYVYICIVLGLWILHAFAPFISFLRPGVIFLLRDKIDLEIFESYVEAVGMLDDGEMNTVADAMNFSWMYLGGLFMIFIFLAIMAAFWPLFLAWVSVAGISYKFFKSKNNTNG